MAHNIATTNGKPAFAFYGDEPWHKLGTKLESPATAEEAITAAGLNYDVTMTPVATEDGLSVPNTKAVVRYDTQTVLGVVSDRYVPVQNKQAFGFLDSLVAGGGIRYHTAGALGQGERVFLLAKLPGHIRVKESNDLVDKFLLLSNSHDGTSALRVLFTPIRVVCQNTLSIALHQGFTEGLRIRHKGNLEAKIADAQRVLGIAENFYIGAAEKINRLASVEPTEAQLKLFFEKLYPDPEDGINASRARQTRHELHRLFEQGIGHDMPQIRNTLWTAYNAVTELVDHRTYRGKSEIDRETNRLNNIWWGPAAKIKALAWDMAIELAA